MVSSSDIVGLSSKLISVDSVEETREIPDFLSEWFTKRNFHTEFFEKEGHVSIVASSKGRKEESKKIMFNGHYDVVPASVGWTRDPFKPEVIDGWLYGRGSVDMKANCACACLAAVETAKKIDGELVVNIVADEEKSGRLGSKVLVDNGVIGDACLIGEPTNMKIATGNKGALWVKVTTKGKTGHGANPVDGGENAIVKATFGIDRLFKKNPKSGTKQEKLFYKNTFNIGKIGAGKAFNVIPDACEVCVDCRFNPKNSPEQALELIKPFFPNADYETVFAVNGWDEPRSSIAVKAAKLALPEALEEKKFFGTDAHFYSEKGVPCVLVGAGLPTMLHAPDEKVEVSQLVEFEKFCENWYSHASKLAKK